MSFPDKKNRFLCVAHRGASGYEPENTLRAVKRALELGAPAIEIDVHNAAGHVLVTHDALITRHGGPPVDIHRETFASIRVLDVGKGENIPTLEEVIDVIDGRATLNVELKGRDTARPVCSIIEEHLSKARWRLDGFVLSSFLPDELTIARSLQADIGLGLLLEKETPEYLGLAARLQASFVGVSMALAVPRLIRAAHAQGLEVFVFTVNTAGEMRRLRDMGVDGVFSDYPDLCPP